MRNLILIFILSCFFTSTSYAQVSQDTYLQGYSKTIQGFPFMYHSPIPDVNESLIVRANKNFRPIIWETQALPGKIKGETVSFVWAYGIDTDAKRYDFELSVNGEPMIAFKNPASNEEKQWSVEGKYGSRLTFNVTLIDKYKDQMGFAVLTLPANKLDTGKRVRLEMKGAPTEGRIWYMTFKSAIEDNLTIQQENVIKLKEGIPHYVARFDFNYLGETADCEIKVGKENLTATLNPGYNTLELSLPKSTKPKEYKATVKIGDRAKTVHRFTLRPVKEWYIYLVQHTHTDIGYTRPQTEILPEHLRYIDYALDYCDLTDDYPDDAQFRWTCEASWAVREYLKSRPQEQIDRLLQRVREGRIEITGMFFNFSDIIDEPGLAAQTRTIQDFREIGIDVTTAMQNDVNGIGWCLAEYAEDIGLKYLTMGQHGHRARVPFDIPTAFWWESPSGKRLLAYRSEHYMHGNTLGLISGDIRAFKTNLSKYLKSLEDQNYPFDRTAFQFSGYITDNAPPSTIACEMVKQWNEQYQWPKLRLAIDKEFMKFVEKEHAEDIQTLRVAWPDWWTDGAGSAMMETKATRTVQAEMIATNGLIAMAGMMGGTFPDDLTKYVTDVQDDLLFYDEHTYGADASISDPLSENAVIQWNEKAAYAWDAVKRSSLLREKAMGVVQAMVPRYKNPSITIFNTLNWQRSGQVIVYIDHEILPTNKTFQIIDTEGNEIKAQPQSSRSDGTYWSLWVENVPPLGYKSYEIKVGKEIRSILEKTSYELNFENDFYRLTIDTSRGAISSCFDKELGLELLDTKDSLAMGQFIYETLSNRHQMERFTHNKRDTVYVPLEGERNFLSEIQFKGIKDGPIWKSLLLEGKIPGCADERGLKMEVRLFHEKKLVELHYALHKVTVYDPEAVYVAFPFELEGAKIGFEAQGGIVYPGENQLEGTSSDWNGVQNFAFVRNEDTQVILGSNDVPLMQFGAINTGRYYYLHRPQQNHIFSWVLNNYWTTNFKAGQEGELKWSYYLTSVKNSSNANASRFAWSSRVPMITRVFPPGKGKDHSPEKSFLNLNPENLLLIVAKQVENGQGVLLQIRETEGVETKMNPKELLQSNVFTKAAKVNVLEETLLENPDVIRFNPYETKFIILK